MATFFRSDGWVKSVLGQAIAGAQIFVCTQPADVTFVPPEPLATIYSDPAGLVPIMQPIMTDGFGHYDFYAAFGTYTVVVVTGGKTQQVYPDQTIGFTGTGGGAVSSVFGRTGDVVAQSGDYNVSQITGAAPSASPNFTGTVQIVNAVITGTLKDGTGSVGTSGQLLSSTGTGTLWVTGGGGGSGTVAPGTKGQIALYASNGSTVSGFFNGVFYPETYGAVGNGVTDDTVAIQATINAAAAAGGGVVQFGAKTYLISSALSITTSNVGMTGLMAGGPFAGGPGGTTILCNSASATIIALGNGGAQIHGNLFRDFCISRSITPTTGDGFVLNSVIDAKLDNIWSFDSIHCFSHVNAQLVWYTNCFAEWTTTSNGITGFGYNMVGANTTGFFSTRMSDCIAVNKASSGTFHGMHISTSGNGISDLFCEGFETASCTYGVYIDGTSSNFNENLHFLRTIHDAFTTSAFFITGVSGHDSYVEISGGYVEGVGTAIGIDIENSAGVIVSNVNFIAFGGNSGPCVLINGSSSKNNVVQANVMYCGSSSQVMIKLNGANDNNVSDNVIVGSAAAFTTGISLLNSSFNTVDGNTLSGSGTTGISLDSSSGHNGGVNVVDPTSITTPLADAGTGNFVSIAGGGGGGTVTHTGALTSNAVILGNGTADVKPGAVLPGNAALFYDGTGNFSTPGGGSGSSGSLFNKTWFTTSQRAIGTVYQNTTGQPIIVTGWLVGGGSIVSGITDSSASPTTVVLEQDTSNGFGTNFLFMVPNNNYYKVTASSGTPEAWTELEVLSGSVVFSGDLSGSRTLSTVYQNTSGKAMLVLVDLSGVGASTTVQGISDSGASPTAVVWQSAGVVTGAQSLWIMIPNNHYYKVICSGAAVAHWNEYSLPFNATKSIDYATLSLPLRFLQEPSPSFQQLNIYDTDLFWSVSGTPSQQGNFAMSSGNVIPWGKTPYDNTTMSSGGFSASAIFVSLGEVYVAYQNTGSPTLDHWWEYSLN